MPFMEWANANGYQDYLTIDRKDNDKGYYPGNCRWATRSEQELNKVRSEFVGIDFFADKWRARVKRNGKTTYLGLHFSRDYAKEVRDNYLNSIK